MFGVNLGTIDSVKETYFSWRAWLVDAVGPLLLIFFLHTEAWNHIEAPHNFYIAVFRSFLKVWSH